MGRLKGNSGYQFETPVVQQILKHLKDRTVVQFEPKYDKQMREIVYPSLLSLVNIDTKKSIEILDFLASEQILIKEPYESFYLCPSCNSKDLTLKASCPSCKSKAISSGRALQHLKCGYIGMEESFLSEKVLKCPSCGKPLKALGVDYRKIERYYRCSSCGYIGQNVMNSYLCNYCGTLSSHDRVNLYLVYSYRLNPEMVEKIEKHTIDLSAVKDRLASFNLRSRTDAMVRGRSGVMHYFDLVAWQKQKPDGEVKPDLVLRVVIGTMPLAESSVAAFVAETSDVGASHSILIVVPSMQESAARLAEFYGIMAKSSEHVEGVQHQILEALDKVLNSPTAEREEVIHHSAKAGNDEQIPILIGMLYEKETDMLKTMQKTVELIEATNKRIEDLSRRLVEKS